MKKSTVVNGRRDRTIAWSDVQTSCVPLYNTMVAARVRRGWSDDACVLVPRAYAHGNLVEKNLEKGDENMCMRKRERER